MGAVGGKSVFLLRSEEDGHGQGDQHRSGFPARPAPIPPAPSRVQFHVDTAPDLYFTAKGKGKKKGKGG